MIVDIYNSNATILFDDDDERSMITFDDWDDYSVKENEEGAIESVETQINRSLSADEKAELLDKLTIPLQSRSITNLQARRKSKGLSQSQLAKASGVAVRNIQAYEQNENDIRKAQVGTIQALAKALDCDIEDLI